MSADIQRQYMAILAKLAIRRQSDVDAATFTIYAEDFARFGIPVEELERACFAIGTAPRVAYTTAFPSVGDVLDACREVRAIQYRAAMALRAEQQRKYLDAAPLSQEEAAAWLERIKAETRGRA